MMMIRKWKNVPVIFDLRKSFLVAVHKKAVSLDNGIIKED